MLPASIIKFTSPLPPDEPATKPSGNVASFGGLVIVPDFNRIQSPFTCFSSPAKFGMAYSYSPAGYYSEALLYRKIRIDLDIRGGVTEMVLRKENQGKCCSVGWHKKGHGPTSTSCVRI